MTRQFFNQQFAALISAFAPAQKLPEETQDVYWEMLEPIPEAKFAEGVKACLARCKFFPTIAELGEASMPSVTDYRAPLPPIDHERPKLNWRQQIERGVGDERPRIAGTNLRPALPADLAGLTGDLAKKMKF